LEVVHYAQCPVGHGSFEDRLAGNELHRSVAMHESLLIDAYPFAADHLASFSEPELSHPDTTIQHNGRSVSAPLSTHTIFFFNIVTRVPSIGNICEIGGGYGAPARLWMTNSYKRPRLYAIVDLPESLFFAEVYLRATYGFDRVHYVQPHEEIGSVPDGTILLCPVSRREDLKSITFNVILNTLSMQEMTDDYVAFYRDWLVTQPSNYFYSFNYFLQPADSRGESPNLFAPRLSEHWTILWTSGTSDGSPIAFTNVLAQRAEPGTIMPRNAATIEQYFRRPLTAAAAFPLMHAADTGADSRFAYQLMMAINEDFRHCPKELAFLAGRIHQLELQQGQLSESELACAKRILEDVTSKYSSKVTPAVPKHMRALQRGLYNSGAPQ
jgi:putative sugar O-methyltransferase